MDNKQQIEEKEVEDKFKKTEARLYNYKFIESKQATLENQKKIIMLNDGSAAIRYDKTLTSATNDVNSIMEDIAIDNLEEIEDINKKIKLLQIEKDTIEIALTQLSDEEMELFRIKYMSLDKKSVYQISKEMNIEKNTIYEKRNQLINKVKDILYPKV